MLHLDLISTNITISKRKALRHESLSIMSKGHIVILFVSSSKMNVRISSLEPTIIKLMKKASNSEPLTEQHIDPPPSTKILGDLEEDVGMLLDSCIYYRKLQYKARWTGQGPS